jgi:hypothetical protein
MPGWQPPARIPSQKTTCYVVIIQKSDAKSTVKKPGSQTKRRAASGARRSRRFNVQNEGGLDFAGTCHFGH